MLTITFAFLLSGGQGGHRAVASFAQDLTPTQRAAAALLVQRQDQDLRGADGKLYLQGAQGRAGVGVPTGRLGLAARPSRRAGRQRCGAGWQSVTRQPGHPVGRRHQCAERAHAGGRSRGRQEQ